MRIFQISTILGVLILLCASVTADAQTPVKFEGLWEGRTNISNSRNEMTTSQLSVEIQKNQTGGYTLEMIYMGDKKARFTKCTAKGEDLEITDDFVIDGKMYHIHGKLIFKKGPALEGEIEYQNRGVAGEFITFRVFKIWVERKTR